MLRTAGFIVVLAIGIALGYAAKTYQDSFAVTAVNKTKQAAMLTEIYQLCKSPNMNKESALVIKSEGGRPKEMIFPWHSDADVFRIDQINELHYIATLADQSGTHGPSTLDFNRVSGDLEVVGRYSDEAVKILADICEKRVPADQCVTLMQKLGGNVFNCIGYNFSIDECKKWTSGNNFKGRFQYACRSAERH